MSFRRRLTWPGSPADISRAATLLVSPIAAKLSRPATPTLPTTAGPVLTPTRNVGQSGWASASGRPASTIARAARAARRAWSGWSPAALKIAMTPSPANCSMTPPAASMTGTTSRPVLVEHRDDRRRGAALAERREAREIGEEDAHLAFLAAEPGGGLPLAATDPLGHDRRQVGPERGIEPPQLAGRLDEQRHLVARRALAAQRGEDPLRRIAALVRRGNRRDRACMPAVDAGECRLEVQPAECSRQRAAPAVLAASTEGDRAEGQQHQQVPLPPAQMPVAAQRHGHHRLREQDERHADRQRHDATAPPIQPDVPPGGEQEECGAHRHQQRQRSDALLRRWRPVERRESWRATRFPTRS